MLKKILKWVGISLAGLVLLLVLGAAGMAIAGSMRLNKKLAIQPETIPIPSDAAALERGRHLVEVACKSCHGDDLGGQPMLDDPAIGQVYASNLTAGLGGVGAVYSDADLVRAIRHGVAPDGKPLIIMPSESFIHFSEEDLGAVVAYLRTVPAVDHVIPARSFTIMARILLAAGMFGQPFAAEYIDHNQSFSPMPEMSANHEYGEYLANFCKNCHGPDLAGKQPSDPASPFAPNLTPGGGLGEWSEADFIRTLRTGVNPDGHKMNPEVMPWRSFGKFEDEELQAIWIYLNSLPELATVLP